MPCKIHENTILEGMDAACNTCQVGTTKQTTIITKNNTVFKVIQEVVSLTESVFVIVRLSFRIEADNTD